MKPANLLFAICIAIAMDTAQAKAESARVPAEESDPRPSHDATAIAEPDRHLNRKGVDDYAHRPEIKAGQEDIRPVRKRPRQDG